MSKLSDSEKFFDVSDYGRPIANVVTVKLKNTFITPIQVTFVFGICGLIAIYCIIQHYYYLAGLFLILKSIIDAIDGQLARLKKIPSYTGRYLDSVFDNILNFLLFFTIACMTHTSYWLAIIAYGCMQLQGTVYNYYYVILRTNSVGGDATSKIFETKIPKALPTDNQKIVTILFIIYRLLYSVYDKILYSLDKDASKLKSFPSWFMTFVSFYGLGFQLLLISGFLSLGLIDFIIPFFIFYTFFAIIIIIIRKLVIKIPNH